MAQWLVSTRTLSSAPPSLAFTRVLAGLAWPGEPHQGKEFVKVAKVIGDGAHRYEVIEDWGNAAPRLVLWRGGGGRGRQPRQRLCPFSRGAHPMIVFDREGRFLRSWGEGRLFACPHGIHVAPDDTLWCTDA